MKISQKNAAKGNSEKCQQDYIIWKRTIEKIINKGQIANSNMQSSRDTWFFFFLYKVNLLQVVLSLPQVNPVVPSWLNVKKNENSRQENYNCLAN